MTTGNPAAEGQAKSLPRPENSDSIQGSWPLVKTLAVKELRETAWIGAISLAAYFLVVGVAIAPWLNSAVRQIPGLNTFTYTFLSAGQDRTFPFLGDGFGSAYAIISLGLALALGYRQSLGETRGNTYNFLLHRPVARNTVFLTKLAVGVVLLLGCATLPVLVYGCWAATPGTHPAPFEWSMTLGTWKVWIAMPLVYLGAFLSGIRPARWRGTRLVPLIAAGVATVAAAALPLWWLSGGPIIVLVAVLLVASILWVGTTRDFS